MFLNFFLQSSTVVSDTVSNAVANANSTPSTTDSVSYLDFLLKGGIMIIPIIILLFFCIYVIVERFLSIKKATRQDENMINDVRIQLKSGKIDNAIIEQVLSEEKYDFVQFIISNHYPIDDNILNLCIKSRNKEQIKKLLDLGCKWTIYSFSYGALTLDITLLKWLKDNGCFWGILHPDHLTIIKSNNNIITWLKENKCNWILC